MTSGQVSTTAVQFLVTCFFFFLEALLHYNIGKHGSFGFSWPPAHELGLLTSSIVVCAYLSSVVAQRIDNALAPTDTGTAAGKQAAGNKQE